MSDKPKTFYRTKRVFHHPELGIVILLEQTPVTIAFETKNLSRLKLKFNSQESRFSFYKQLKLVGGDL